jgi:hypothetical protein
MADSEDQVVRGSGNGLAEGLGSDNTQGPVIPDLVEPDALVYGLGSAETQSDPGDPGHVAIDHSEYGAESGLPLGLGSEDTQDGPPMPHPIEPDSLEFGLGSPETQQVDQSPA